MNATNIDRTAGSLELGRNQKVVRTTPSDGVTDTKIERASFKRVKGPRLLFFNLPAYRSPMGQTLIITLVHSLVVGMFNVLSALGGGGQVDPTTSNNSNTILYSLFAVLAIASGSVCNYIGP